MALRRMLSVRHGTGKETNNGSRITPPSVTRNLMKTIPLTQGKIAIVDDADYNWLKQWKWYANKIDRNYYAVRNVGRGKILMHRVILNAPDGLEIDHVNNNGLDNRQSNLRLCTRAENDRSQRLSCRNKVGYKGVYIIRRKSSTVYAVQICANYKCFYYGRYSTPEEAARVYDGVALKHHGQFALTNEMLGLL